jgi:hypothetical protein
MLGPEFLIGMIVVLALLLFYSLHRRRCAAGVKTVVETRVYRTPYYDVPRSEYMLEHPSRVGESEMEGMDSLNDMVSVAHTPQRHPAADNENHIQWDGLMSHPLPGTASANKELEEPDYVTKRSKKMSQLAGLSQHTDSLITQSAFERAKF